MDVDYPASDKRIHIIDKYGFVPVCAAVVWVYLLNGVEMETVLFGFSTTLLEVYGAGSR